MPVEHDDNTQDEKDEIADKRKKGKSKLSRVDAAWERLVQTEDGRTVLWDVMARAGIMMTPLAMGADADFAPYRTFANIGRSDYGRELYAEIARRYPAMMVLMQKENMK
jgi:hypothetical protein